MAVLDTRQILLLWVTVLVAVFVQGCDGKTLWLHSAGNDETGCGERDSPCKTMEYVFNTTQQDMHLDVIFDTTSSAYVICSKTVLHVAQNVSLSTFGDIGLTGCTSRPSHEALLTMYGIKSKDNNYFVHFIHGSFSNITTEIQDLHTVVDNCTFTNSSLAIFNKSPLPRDFGIRTTEWHGDVSCRMTGGCNPASMIQVKGEMKNITFTDSKFEQTVIHLDRTLAENVVIKDCIVTNDEHKLNAAGGIRMKVKPLSNNLYIFVINCVFIRQRSADPIDSTVQLSQAGLFIRPYEGKAMKTYIEILNCTFEKNERGLFLSGNPAKIIVKDCLFDSNAAIHPGAAIYINAKGSQGGPSEVFISESEFIGNSAGRFAPENYVKDKQKGFEVDDGEVSMAAECCNGKMSLQGKGGAIRVQGGVVFIKNCNFSRNIALRLGGSMFIDYKGNVSIYNTSFDTSDNIDHVTHGGIIHSNGTLLLDKVVLHAKAAVDFKSIFEHNGLFWSIRVIDAQVLCPPGYVIRSSNASSYKIQENVGLFKSIVMDKLSYFCEPCPRLNYDLTPGFMHYKVSPREMAYLTLRVDGVAPNLAKGGQLIVIQPRCLPCPYGGVCEIGIAPQEEFWGFEHGGALEFIHCPDGYCCTGQDCTTYNSCGTHRHGTICGQCDAGYTESIYSSRCILQSTCNWLWLALPVTVTVVFGILTFILVSIISSDVVTKVDKCVWIDTDGAQMSTVLKESLNGLELSPSTECDTNQDKLGFFALVLTSLWYIQDVKFFRIHSSYDMISHVHDVIAAVSSFRLEEIKLLEDACVFTNLLAWQKQLLNLVMVPSLFVFYYILVVIVEVCKSLGKSHKTGQMICSKLRTGTIIILYIVLQSLLLSTLKLVHCYRVGESLVLYISGSVQCYESWQYVMLSYLFACLGPLPLCFFFGPLLQYPAANSLIQIILGLLLPGPAFIFLLCKTIRQKCVMDQKRRKTNRLENHEPTSVVLYDSYKVIKFPKLGPVSWIGMHIAYRFALVALSVYVTNHLMRVLCMSITCFIFLLFHSHLRPYKRDMDNNIATGAYSLLMATGVVNCVKATFSTANRKPQGPNAVLFLALQHIENSLCIWLPALFIISVILYGICKAYPGKGECHNKRKYNHENNELQMTMISKHRGSDENE